MTTFKAYGPQRKINFPTTGLYNGRIYMGNTTSCWSLGLQKMTLTNASGVN